MLPGPTFWTFWTFCENVACPDILNILDILWKCRQVQHFGHSEHFVKMLPSPTFWTFWTICQNVAWPDILDILNILWKCCRAWHFEHSDHFVKMLPGQRFWTFWPFCENVAGLDILWHCSFVRYYSFWCSLHSRLWYLILCHAELLKAIFLSRG